MATKTPHSMQMSLLAKGSNCPRCGAYADEECRTPAGVMTSPHTARVDRAAKQYLSAKAAR